MQSWVKCWEGYEDGTVYKLCYAYFRHFEPCLYLLRYLHAIPMDCVAETDSSLSPGAQINLQTAPMLLEDIWTNAVQSGRFGKSVSRWLTGVGFGE